MAEDSQQPEVRDENAHNLIYSDGSSKHFYLSKGYRYRDTAEQFDDQANAARWQDHVYAAAFDLARRNDCRRILDIGCGSGFKLMKYFSAFETMGVELPAFVETLKTRYPDNQWIPVDEDADDSAFPPADLYICSDVIEHIRQPDVFMRKIARSPYRYLVLSTPAREVLFADGRREFTGPPDNKAHHFEWTMGELNTFLKPYVTIKRHFYDYNGEYTQIIIAEQKG